MLCCPHAVRLLVLLALALVRGPVHAAPIVPTRDDEVIEVLPASAGERAEERRARQALAAHPQDAALAASVARRELDRARARGDPRDAGRALAALAHWTDPATMPAEVLLLRATVLQYLHDFDGAASSLEALVARPAAGPQPQAWLTLATVRRVQGRYAESDAACREVARAGAQLHGRACAAENDALRGDAVGARRTFAALLSQPGLPLSTLTWLVTSLAELEERDGRASAAEAAYRAALQVERDPYATLAYADFLIAHRRPGDALRLLVDEPRTDAVLLRLAIAGGQAGSADAARDAAEMRERIALANERPEARVLHGREQALFALEVEHDAPRALALARGNVARQREPIDLLVYAQAARASGDADARRDVRRLCDALGLHDRRVEGLL
jgi:hypothetical protein